MKKNKIIFWLDMDMIHYGIAKFLQDKLDCEMYAIIDINNLSKKFFVKQNLVKFKDVWFYRDHTNNHKREYDLTYLQSFEKKYNVDLWPLVYTEQIFFYNKYHSFSRDEILSVLSQECKFFENVLEYIKPDYLFMKNSDQHQNHLFMKICNAKGVKTLMLGLVRFGYKVALFSDTEKIHDLGVENSTNEIIDQKKYLEKYNTYKQQNVVKTRLQISVWRKYKGYLHLLRILDKDYRKYYHNYGKTRLKVLFNELPPILKKLYRELQMNKYLTTSLSYDEPFVYFPLHVDPEASLSLIAPPYYLNQFEVIMNIAKSLPVGIFLYVKEHPSMARRGWRSLSFYKKISSLPNVRMIHYSVPVEKIYDKCQMVITIAGTAGIEAAFYNKPSIVFSDLQYSTLPFVYRLKSLEDLPRTIKLAMESKHDFSLLRDYLLFIERNTIDFDILELLLDSFEHFGKEGFLADSEIPNSKMESFFKKNQAKFEKLVDLYLHAIKNNNFC